MVTVAHGQGRYRAGLLGTGNIGAGWDEPADAAITTHLKACLAERRFELTMLADADRSRATRERDRLGARSEVVDIDALLDAELDVLCIATPDETHLDYARACRARVVLVEKPLGGDDVARRELLAAIKRRGGTLIVHHQRRWIPGLAAFAAEARDGAVGRPLAGSVHYTRGLRHNGVHALDLLAATLGTRVATARAIGTPVIDRDPRDPTRSLLLELIVDDQRVPVLCIGIDGRRQTVFAVDIRFERGRLVVADEDGVRAYFHRPHPVDTNGFAPELRTQTSFHDNPPRLTAAVWSSIADHLDGGAEPPSSNESALAAYDLADAMIAALDARAS
jgi:predicted dehydrogenase